MIILYQPPPAWGLPNISPFCVKLETYLRMTKLPYQVAMADVLKEAPNGRIPYVKIDGTICGDSTLIIQKLKERWGDPLDEALSAGQKAHALMIQRLVEDHLYYAIAWLRWSDENAWKYLHDYFKPLMPPVVAELILKMMRKGMLQDLRKQGMGEHAREDVIRFASEDLTALSVFLGRQSFFLGDQPSSIDATVFGFLIHQLWVPWESPVKQYGLSLTNLFSFCERMKGQYWAEYQLPY